MEDARAITFANEVQAGLFELEISGQISDGFWENASPYNHWTWVRSLEVTSTEVSFLKAGKYGVFPRRKYNLTSKALLDVVGHRMVNQARLIKAFGREVAKSVAAYADSGRLQSRQELAEWAERSSYYAEVLKVRDTIDDSEVEAALADETYGMKDLRKDLRAMSEIINN